MSKTINNKIPKLPTFSVKEKIEKNKTRVREFSAMNVKDFDTFKKNVQTFLENKRRTFNSNA